MFKTFLSITVASSFLLAFDINTASVKDYEKIHGVGEASAKKVVEYRTKHGAFKTVEELKKSDINTNVYNAIIKHIESAKKSSVPATQPVAQPTQQVQKPVQTTPATK